MTRSKITIITASSIKMSSGVISKTVSEQPLMKYRSAGLSTFVEKQLKLLKAASNGKTRLVVLKGRRNIFNDPWLLAVASFRYFYIRNPGQEPTPELLFQTQKELLQEARNRLQKIAEENQQTN